MSNLSFHDTIFGPRGHGLINVDAAMITLKERTHGVVYTPKEDERRPGAMYPRCIVLNHNKRIAQIPKSL